MFRIMNNSLRAWSAVKGLTVIMSDGITLTVIMSDGITLTVIMNDGFMCM